MCKELEELKQKILSVPTMIVILIALCAVLLVFAPMMVRAASNATNGTGFEQVTANWTGRANLSITVASDGWVVIVASIDGRVNSSGNRAQGRFLQNGNVISLINLTESVYLSNGVILGASYVTAGTYTYSLETSAPPGTKYIAHNWTFFVSDISGGGSGGNGNVSSVLANSPLSSSGTDVVTISINPNAVNFRNDSISELALFINNTFVPLSNTSYLKNSTFFCGANTTCTYNANGSVSISAIGGSSGSNYNATYDAKMSNPATTDLNMGNYNITGLGQNESYSYLIWTDGTNYYAKNGSTGKVDYKGTDIGSITTSAFNSLPSDRTYQAKIILRGTFNLYTGIKVPSYSVLDLTEAKLIRINNDAGALVQTPLFDAASYDKITILGGFIEGNKTNLAVSSVRGISLFGVTNAIIDGATVRNTSYVGVLCEHCVDSVLRNLNVSHAEAASIDLDGSTRSVVYDSYVSNTEDTLPRGWGYSIGLEGTTDSGFIRATVVDDPYYAVIQGKNPYITDSKFINSSGPYSESSSGVITIKNMHYERTDHILFYTSDINSQADINIDNVYFEDDRGGGATPLRLNGYGNISIQNAILKNTLLWDIPNNKFNKIDNLRYYNATDATEFNVQNKLSQLSLYNNIIINGINYYNHSKYYSNIDKSQLLLDYNFNQNGTSAVIYDAAKSPHDGIWYGNSTPNWTADGGIKTDGIDDNITINGLNADIYSLYLEFNNPIIWTQSGTLQTILKIGTSTLYANGNCCGNPNGENILFQETTGYSGFAGEVSSGRHTLVFTWNITANAYDIYLDGRKKEKLPTAQMGLISSSTPIMLGTNNAGTNGNLTFYRLQLYGRSLSENEILSAYYSTGAISERSSFIQSNNFRIVNNSGYNIFNLSDTGKIWNGTAWDWFLMPSKVLAGTNVTVTNNNNGSVTISSTGGTNYNATYELGISNLQNNNTADRAYVNATFEPKITNGTSNQFLNGLKSYISLVPANITGFDSTVQSLITAYGYITSALAYSSFQNSSTGFYLNNGSNALAVGCCNNTILNSIDGTITGIRTTAPITGNIEISVLYNATSFPLYPQDVCSSLTTSNSQNISMSCAISKWGIYRTQVITNSGGITEVNIGLMLRRS